LVESRPQRDDFQQLLSELPRLNRSVVGDVHAAEGDQIAPFIEGTLSVESRVSNVVNPPSAGLGDIRATRIGALRLRFGRRQTPSNGLHSYTNEPSRPSPAMARGHGEVSGREGEAVESKTALKRIAGIGPRPQSNVRTVTMAVVITTLAVILATVMAMWLQSYTVVPFTSAEYSVLLFACLIVVCVIAWLLKRVREYRLS